MSNFNTGGTLAFGVGPPFITLHVQQSRPGAMPATMLIGLAVLGFLYQIIPAPRSEGLQYAGFIGSLKDTLGPVWRPIAFISD
jgi:FSR family fosmidomycin resistance protein-like MFS transporter